MIPSLERVVVPVLGAMQSLVSCLLTLLLQLVSLEGDAQYPDAPGREHQRDEDDRHHQLGEVGREGCDLLTDGGDGFVKGLLPGEADQDAG